jgi:hypothetical protein
MCTLNGTKLLRKIQKISQKCQLLRKKAPLQSLIKYIKDFGGDLIYKPCCGYSIRKIPALIIRRLKIENHQFNTRSKIQEIKLFILFTSLFFLKTHAKY